MLHRFFRVFLMVVLSLFASFELFAVAFINENAPIQFVKLPPSDDVYVRESVTLRFETKKDVIETLKAPIVVDNEAINIIARKFELVLGEPLYPSQIAHLVFEVAFTDVLSCRLMNKQRQENLGYILSNLGLGNSQLSTYIFAFYYGYSFQYWAQIKNM